MLLIDVIKPDAQYKIHHGNIVAVILQSRVRANTTLLGTAESPKDSGHQQYLARVDGEGGVKANLDSLSICRATLIDVTACIV